MLASYQLILCVCLNLHQRVMIIIIIYHLPSLKIYALFVLLIVENLKGELDAYVKSLEQENPALRIVRVRHTEQRGLAHARASGWRAATADVVAILDAHIEVHEMW